MKKIIDWEIKFNQFIDKHKNKPFAWGTWDCCKFSNALIKEITEEDLIPKSLKWKDEKTAMIAKKACMSKKVNQINPAFMSKGDLVVYKEESQLVGICDGMYILTPTDDCIGVKTDVNVLGVWRIDG